MTTRHTSPLRPFAPVVVTLLAALGLGLGACAVSKTEPSPEPRPRPEPPGDSSAGDPRIQTDGPTSLDTPIGLALEVENGVGVPLSVRAGQRVFINQIDLRSFITTKTDEGVAGLTSVANDFQALDWTGTERIEADFVGMPNPDGSFTRRTFYRGAAWMEQPSQFRVRQVDGEGQAIGPELIIEAGADQPGEGDMFIRRFRAIQWALDCAAPGNCDGAGAFMEEGLVELRNSVDPGENFQLDPQAAALELVWSLRQDQPYAIPLTQVEAPKFDYGFDIEVEALTTPQADGSYAPGTEISFRLTLTDGAGTRLHEPGALPSYAAVNLEPGGDEGGITYYRGFFDPTAVYYRRKHRERMFAAEIIGPAQAIEPLRAVASLDSFLSQDQVPIAELERDGVWAEAQTFPVSPKLFGGALDPKHEGWLEPVTDQVSFSIPEDAPAGTYLLAIKARRVYLGQDIPHTTTVEIQVGDPTPTTAELHVGNCETCHSGGGDLELVLHGEDNLATCGGCHTPLSFELEGPVYVRTHFIHSRSDRFGASPSQCSSCHLDNAGIQRTSRSACLSCHTSYPEQHVEQFGPISNMYVGDGTNSFEQCSDRCHTTHPNSGL